jgi:hypothetical protein
MELGYAIEIDHSYDAVVLRDMCRKAAETHEKRARLAQTHHSRRENTDKAEIFRRYEERLEHIRKQEASRISVALGLEP